MIKKILVATDDSEPAQKALTYAIDLAATLRASLTAIHVVDMPSIVGRQAVPEKVSPTHLFEPVEDYMKQAAETFMADLRTSCSQQGIHFEGIIKTGHPVEEIAKTARDIHADMIILGSHGRGALGSALLGSITLGVIHQDMHIPVLIVK